MEREFLGVWIPKEIYLHTGLTPTEKLLLAEIMSFSKNGVCFASNEHFAEFLGISRSHVSRLIGKLVKMKLVTLELTYKEGTKEVDKRIITPTLPQEQSSIPVLTEDQTPILIEDDPIRIDAHTPMRIDAHTPTHGCVDPLRTDAHTPTHGCVDPMRIDAYYKEHLKESFKEQDKIQIKKRKNNIPVSVLEEEFDRLWNLYPRKAGDKKTARKKYIELRKTDKVTYEEVENGLYRYLRHLEDEGTETQFIPHGSTWFNQQRWDNEYLLIAPKKKIKNFMDLMNTDFGGENFEHGGNAKVIDYDPSYFPYS